MGLNSSKDTQQSNYHNYDYEKYDGDDNDEYVDSLTTQMPLYNEPDMYDPNEQLRFHEVHGSNIRLNKQKTIACRYDGYCRALAFTHRPIRLNEWMYVKLTKLCTSWNGSLRIGFTRINPSHNELDLRNVRYSCPDLTNKKGYWSHGVHCLISQNDVLSYCVNKNGTVFYSLNNGPKNVLFEGIKAKENENLWGLFDVYGNTVSIELLDIREPEPVRENVQLNIQPETQEPQINEQDVLEEIDDLRNQFRHLADNDFNESLCGIAQSYDRNNNEIDINSVNSNTILQLHTTLYHANVQPSVQFHPSIHGRNVHLTHRNDIAYRISNEPLSHAYVFVNQRLRQNDSVCIQILNVDLTNEANANISLSFGCTNCNLNMLTVNDLPSDSYNLLDRKEYWIVNKNILNNAQSGDELCFRLNPNGNIEYIVNGRCRTSSLFNVDTSQSFYFFFDICGKTTAIRLLQSCPTQDKCPTDTIPNRHISKQIRRTMSKDKIILDECSVCFERPVECVIYSCGHMCFCWKCALQVMKKNTDDSKCPICRLKIKDVIRIYKS